MQEAIVRKSNERGYFDHGWLKSFHTFSFAEYYDPKFMGFGNLRVINDDIVQAGTGFGMHPHKNMEIVTYIISGQLTHSDNLGNKEAINEGEVQIMSAGSGIVHSEWNYTNTPCHLLQIWIKPNQIGGDAYYKIYKPDHFEKWALIASNTKDDNTKIKQDASIYTINSGSLKHTNLPNKSHNGLFWLHVATGTIKIGDTTLKNGDAISFKNADSIAKKLEFLEQSKVLFFIL